MTTQTIITEIKNEFKTEHGLFENYFADAIESANNYAIDNTAEVFNLKDVEFYEDGVSGIEDTSLEEKVNYYYFDSFENSLRSKAKGIYEELNRS